MFERAIDKTVRVLNYIGMAILFALMCLVTVDVVLRYVFNRPIKGGIELNELGLAVIVFLGLSYTALLKGHVAVDLIVNRLSAKKQAVIDIINSFLGIVVYSLIAWQGLDKAIYSRMKGEVTDILRISQFPFKLFVTIGSILLCLVLITYISRAIGKLRERS